MASNEPFINTTTEAVNGHENEVEPERPEMPVVIGIPQVHVSHLRSQASSFASSNHFFQLICFRKSSSYWFQQIPNSKFCSAFFAKFVRIRNEPVWVRTQFSRSLCALRDVTSHGLSDDCDQQWIESVRGLQSWRFRLSLIEFDLNLNDANLFDMQFGSLKFTSWPIPHVFYDKVLLRHPITNHHVCPPSVDMFVDMKLSAFVINLCRLL